MEPKPAPSRSIPTVHFPLLIAHCLRLTVCCLILTALLASCGLPATPTPTLAHTPSSTRSPIPSPTATTTATLTPSPTLSPTPAPTQTPYIVTATSASTPIPRGLFILSLIDNGYTHLFAYSPLTLTLTRLTADSWDDITPALSPDASQVAFTSRRNGYWDLYLLELETGMVTRLTDTLAYDASPSWSPDGRWLAYESYVDDNLEIFIHSATDPDQPPNRLTEDSAADFSPAWSPQGRQIAFISDRGGTGEVWLADLDQANITRINAGAQGNASHPAWSPDGKELAWALTDASNGLSTIQVWNASAPGSPPRAIGVGDWSIWQDATHIATRISTANQSYLTAYAIPSGNLSLPPFLLVGALRGLSHGLAFLPEPLPLPYQAAAAVTPTALYQSVVSPQPGIPTRRASLVSLEGVQAPYPQLQDAVDESFLALRRSVAAVSGWDLLASLENAYVPLTTPLDPGLGEDWLYTGRALSLDPALAETGLIRMVREDFGEQTYWRIYIRTRAQDGSQGEPMHQMPWDFSTRYSGNPTAFEQGGSLMSNLPDGYWLDFTALARQYGWERLPALSNWRTYFTGTRFNEFALTGGLTWREAMLDLYPPEMLMTPTVVIPPTRTPTRTPWGYKTPTPTRTPTPHPTFTSSP